MLTRSQAPEMETLTTFLQNSGLHFETLDGLCANPITNTNFAHGRLRQHLVFEPAKRLGVFDVKAYMQNGVFKVSV